MRDTLKKEIVTRDSVSFFEQRSIVKYLGIEFNCDFLRIDSYLSLIFSNN